MGQYVFNENGLQNRYYGWALEQALTTHSVVVGTVVNIVDPTNPSSFQDVQKFNDWASQLMLNNFLDDDATNDLDHTEPLSPFIYPVYNTSAEAVKDENVEAAQEVALIVSYFYWRDFLKDILPTGERGLVVVVANECNQSFTYQVNGGDPVYLGPGDLHDPAYDLTEIKYSLKELSSANSGKKGSYSGLKVNGFCPYTITTYASEDMESSYKNNDPIYFTIAIVIVFVFTALVFFAYDKLVETRQKKVLKTAQKSNAIVSSLFPSHIRDKLMEEGSQDGKSSSYQTTKTTMKTFVSGGQLGEVEKLRPIADLFPVRHAQANVTFIVLIIKPLLTKLLSFCISFYDLLYRNVRSFLQTFLDSLLGRASVIRRKYLPCWRLCTTLLITSLPVEVYSRLKRLVTRTLQLSAFLSPGRTMLSSWLSSLRNAVRSLAT
jgi:hypothetical protein